jgi:hypothetical protein
LVEPVALGVQDGDHGCPVEACETTKKPEGIVGIPDMGHRGERAVGSMVTKVSMWPSPVPPSRVSPIESTGHALTEFLRLGAAIEIPEPAALREQVVQTVRDLAALCTPS